MSDEPSDAQKIIAEVIATHRSLFDGEACDACDWKFTNEYYGHDEHVAVEVDKALGGLTKVWSEVVVMDDGYTYPQWNEWYDEQHHAQKAVYDNPGTVLGEALMSGWTVTE
ncbi:hypothetical protein [Mycobacteroides abscessus]